MITYSWFCDKNYILYKNKFITKKQWNSFTRKIVIHCTAYCDLQKINFIITQKDIENFYGVNEIDLQKVNIHNIWKDMFETENYLENCFLSKGEV